MCLSSVETNDMWAVLFAVFSVVYQTVSVQTGDVHSHKPQTLAKQLLNLRALILQESNWRLKKTPSSLQQARKNPRIQRRLVKNKEYDIQPPTSFHMNAL